MPGGEMTFEMELKMDDKQFVTGVISSPQGEFEINDGNYKPDSGKVYLYGENPDDDVFVDIEGKLEENQIVGDASVNDAFTVEFSATRQAGKADADKTDTEEPASSMQDEQEEKEEKEEEEEPTEKAKGFLGVFINDDLSLQGTIEGSPAEKAGLKKGDVITAISNKSVESRNELLEQLSEKSAGDKVTITVRRDDESMDVEVALAERPGNVEAPADADEAPKQESTEETAGEAAASKTETSDDMVSGTWKGTIESNQGASDLTIEIKRDEKGNLTGSYQTTRSDGEITEGTFNKETGAMNLVADSGRFSLDFIGKVEGDSYEGDIEFNQGTFTMPFSAKRVDKSTPDTKATAQKEDKPSAKTSGKTLKELVPGPRWVSSLHASRFKAERCYISFDGHRSNDDEPYLFATEDFGKTWTSIRGNLPASAGSVRVLREDRKNENVLYLGCEFGAWVSIDRGKSWTKFKNLPTVAVHEFAQHPTLNDVLIATHGRSLWITDVTLLRQTQPDIRNTAKKLYQPSDVIAWRSQPRRGSSGNRKFVGENPENNAKICYSLGANASRLELTIQNVKGEVVKRFDELSTRKGLHVMSWDLRRSAARGPRNRFGGRVPAGDYLVSLRIDGELIQTTLTILADPEARENSVTPDSELQWWLDFAGENNQIDQ